MSPQQQIDPNYVHQRIAIRQPLHQQLSSMDNSVMLFRVEDMLTDYIWQGLLTEQEALQLAYTLSFCHQPIPITDIL